MSYCCPKCGKPLSASDVEDYPFVCHECDENFYQFEAVWTDWNMEPGCCPNCGSDNANVVRIDKGYNILVWYECRECGGEFIECYSMDSKGIPTE